MLFRVTKRMEIAGAHRLALPYKSKCAQMHGHNWIVTVTCESQVLNAEGMVIDFSAIKSIVGRLDHENLNDHVPQPTAENIAEWIMDQIPLAVEVKVQESEGNCATAIR